MVKELKDKVEKLELYKRILIVLGAVGFLTVIFFRLWKTPEFFSFNFDEEYQATLAWSIVKDFHVIWIGVSTSGLKYYLGPGFTYLNAALFYLSKGDPKILAYFASFWGLVTAASIFYIAKKLFGLKTAVISTLIYGASALMIFYDRRFWNPLPIPFIAIWLTYSLIKARGDDNRWFILTAILMGSAFHVHLSLMLFWPVVLGTIVLNAKRIKLKTWLFMIGSYLLITSPLIVFDFVHNFDNLLAPLKFLTGTGEEGHTPIQGLIIPHLQYFWLIIGRIWFLRFQTNIQEEHNLGIHGQISSPHFLLSALSFLILFYLFFIVKSDRKTLLLKIVMFLYAVAFVFYPGVAGEYFLLAFLALFTIAAGIFLSRLPLVISVLTLIIFVALNTITIVNSNQGVYGLSTRRKLITSVMKTVGDNSFSLETYGPDKRKYHPYGGWRYLFKVYGRAPNQSFADEFFGWIYQDEILGSKSDIKVVITENMNLNNRKVIKVYEEGAYKAYVFKEE